MKVFPKHIMHFQTFKILYIYLFYILGGKNTELVFLNPYGAQESMQRHQFRQPM